MATLTVTYPFSSSLEGWTLVTIDGSLSLAYDTGHGNPTPCISVEHAYYSGNSAGYLVLTSDWESLGVPAGSTITALTTSYDWAFVDSAGENTLTFGPFAITDTSGGYNTVIVSSLTDSGTISSPTFSNTSGSNSSLPSELTASADNVNFVLNLSSRGEDDSTFFIDNVQMEITYSPPNASGSGSLVIDHPTIDGSGTSTPPSFTGDGTLVVDHPLIVGSGNPDLSSGMGGLTVAHPVIVGSGESHPPLYTGYGPLVVDHPLLSSAATYDVYTGDSTLTVDHPTLTGEGSTHYPIASQPLNLFIGGPPAPGPVYNSLPLYILGDVSDPAANTISLEHPGIPLNLFIVGGSWGNVTEAVNLYTKGGYFPATSSTTLFIANTPPTWGSAPLYVAGSGLNPGYLPSEQSLNLFLKRGPNAGICLSINGCIGVQTAPLYIFGTQTSTSDTTLYISGFGGSISSSMTLALPYVLDPLSVNGQIDLVIPYTYDSASGLASLFVNGW